MKKKLIYLTLLSAALVACDFAPEKGEESFKNTDFYSFDDGNQSVEASDPIDIVIDESSTEVSITDSVSSNITDLTADGITYDDTQKLFTITKAGTFEFKGSFNGNILVNAGDKDDVKVTLNGFTIASEKDSPIKCDNAGELQVSIKSGSQNYIYDNRSAKTADDDTQGNGAITSSCDMKLSGSGSLVIYANYYNGIHCKDDLNVKPEVKNNSSVQIKSYNNCLKGNDSVEIKSGNLVLISTCGNGILTENTDVSDKGNQRGSVVISGGHIDIYSAKDAIDAAYNAEVSKPDGGDDPVINIYTSKFSSYTEGTTGGDSESTKLYLKVSSNLNFSSTYSIGVCYLNNDSTTTWSKASLISSGGGGSRSSYFQLNRPSKATSFKVALFASSVTTLSEANATAIMSSYKTINSNYNMAYVSVSTTSVSTTGWSNYSSGGGQPGGQPGMPGGNEGNDDKSEVSAKGIKADNEIIISAGIFFIKTYDDAIHANYGETLENSSTGLGNVKISGGNLELYASDDAIHADDTLTISGGTIDVVYSYEGLEGNVINISGGQTRVYSVDDGLNAANKSGKSPVISVSGGFVDITVSGQDVDGIDSNGTFTQSGGYVITKGANGGMSTGLDTDGTATISGGTFVCFGKPEKTPSKGSGVTSYTLSGSYSVGTYTITFGDNSTASTTTKYSYSIVYVYSSLSTQISIVKA